MNNEALNTNGHNRNIHLLVADDQVEILQQAIEFLQKRFGYEHVETAESAKVATEKLAERPFDVIVADMRMEQDNSGFAIIEEVQRRKISSIVIVLTANDSVEDCRQSFKLGASDYIRKNQPGNVWLLVDRAIQEAVTYLKSWGNDKDKRWISNNMGYLLDSHQGQYVAITNNQVIASADSREVLEAQIREQKLPRFLTIERVDAALFRQMPAQLIVFVEGPTDVTYLKTALKILECDDLLNSIVVSTIGSPMGGSGGGHTFLKGGFYFLCEHRLLTKKVLFLFDPDVKDSDLPNARQDMANFYIRRMADYSADKRGIESLFADQILEEGLTKGFVSKKETITTTRTGKDSQTSYKVIKKTAFCDWICTERGNTVNDFAGFKPIITMIEEILAK